MSEALRMCAPTMSEDSSSAIGLQELQAGRLPCDVLDGMTLDQSGPAPAHANLSARQAREKGLLTSGTYGRTSSTSSSSVALQQSLASRLQALTASCGSTLYRLTWKQRATPSERQICALRASAARTSGSASTGWPTATSTEALRIPSPDLTTKNVTLNHAAALAGWGTPTATEPGGTGEQYIARSRPSTGNSAPTMLAHQAAICGPARFTATGEMLTGLDAGMESGGRLAPAHSRWLMGYPRVWDECGMKSSKPLRGK